MRTVGQVTMVDTGSDVGRCLRSLGLVDQLLGAELFTREEVSDFCHGA